jgi:DNA-binding SARP family transcriptional activator
VSLSIQLLGPPRIDRGGGGPETTRGLKTWGLLAYLVVARVPPSRERLAELLFPEADDPFAALRWTLSELRRQLGPEAEVRGDPLRLSLPPGTLVDVDIVSRGSWMEAVALPGLGQEFLEGLVFRSSPGFEMWLENERRHVAGTTSAVLHQAALALLGRGDAAGAARHASELVRLNRYDENANVLLVRSLRLAGDAEGAARQAAACTELFRRELGTDPTPALHDAAASPPPRIETHVSGRTAVRAQIEAGKAALSAGAAETGVHRMRGAVHAARSAGDRDLLAEALVGLGGALVHSARGTDEEGAVALHEATTLAEEIDRSDISAKAWREISWIQFLRAQYERAEESLTRITEHASAGDEQFAWAELIRGACRHDVGDYAAAGELLRSALERSRELDSGQPLGQALTLLARYHLMRGEIEDAVHLLDEALRQSDDRGMTAFVPWPESFRGDIDLVLGDLDTAEERFEHAFALGCQVGDPCWESVALRGLGLVAAARGDVPRALELLVEAPKLCRRLPDTYLWIETYALDALCSVAVEHNVDASARWIDQLEAITARRGVRELLLRATVYRARLGDPGAFDAARSLAAEIDNPALDDLLASGELSPAL